MCRTSSLLFYGFPVRATSLLAAAVAWSPAASGLKISLLTVSLLRSRLKCGTLSTSSPTSRLSSLPLEIWDQIQRFLVLFHGWDGEERACWHVHVGHMSLEWPEDQPEYYDLEHLARCEFCYRAVTDNGGVGKLLKDKQEEQEIALFLADFHLAQALPEPFSTTTLVEFDLDALVPLAFPLHPVDATSRSTSAVSFPLAASTLKHQAFDDKPAFAALDYTAALSLFPHDEANGRFRTLGRLVPLLQTADLEAPSVSAERAVVVSAPEPSGAEGRERYQRRGG
ncbi:hypothetical protein JCM8097_001334 [Rhodosporidiobolus ruineniae]